MPDPDKRAELEPQIFGVDTVPEGVDALEHLVFHGLVFCTLAKAIPGARNILPEPMDVFNHVSNFGLTMAFIEGRTKALFHGSETAHNEENKGKYFGATILAAAGLNIAAEKIGYGPISTPDPIDFAYGILGGVRAYFMAKRRVNHRQFPMGDSLNDELVENNERGLISKFFSKRRETSKRLVIAIETDRSVRQAEKSIKQRPDNRRQRRLDARKRRK